MCRFKCDPLPNLVMTSISAFLIFDVQLSQMIQFFLSFRPIKCATNMCFFALSSPLTAFFTDKLWFCAVLSLLVLLQQIKIPPQFANSNTINPPLLDIQQCLPHHLQCQWCPRNRLLGSGGWDDQEQVEQDVVRWHLSYWKTLQSSWLIAELPSKRKEVERNIEIGKKQYFTH